MKKSNWIILGFLAVAAAFFLWLWYALQLNVVDNPFDLVLVIVWWAVVALACVAIHLLEQKRQERVRTCYVAAAPKCVFNAEAGSLWLEKDQSYMDVLQRILTGLKYNFELADVPKKDKVSFCAIVRTSKFEAGSTIHEDPKQWVGEVVDVANSNKDPQSFNNPEELERLLAQIVPRVAATDAPATQAVSAS